ncbi:MAG: VOC family protein [Thermomicrobiaceae bacterium]|nr:VOC family protein [Thermomicrobiaceae bacterium]
MVDTQVPVVATLAHVELLSPKPAESLWFFTNVLGMTEVGREGQSVYLRAYEDVYHSTLKLTEAEQPGLGHCAWRVSAPQLLDEAAARIEAAGYGLGWRDGDLDHGPAFQFRTPDGHRMELLWEVTKYQAPPDQQTTLRNRRQRRPLRGVPVRRIDHINCFVRDVEGNEAFLRDQLGFKLRETKIGEDGSKVGSWLSVSPLVHEIAIMRDGTGQGNRLHHVAYWYGYPQHCFDVADACRDWGITIEAGPAKHGTTQAMFLYVYEPGGNRIELFGDAGYLIFDPDWDTIVWDVSYEADLYASSVWLGAQAMPGSFYVYGTPEKVAVSA